MILHQIQIRKKKKSFNLFNESLGETGATARTILWNTISELYLVVSSPLEARIFPRDFRLLPFLIRLFKSIKTVFDKVPSGKELLNHCKCVKSYYNY